jgi:hypothetical protein
MPKPNPSTERSIAVLARALERAIDDYIAAIAPHYPGIPRDVIKAEPPRGKTDPLGGQAEGRVSMR